MKQASVTNFGNSKGSHKGRWLTLSLAVIALVGWLCAAGRFPVSQGSSASAATAMVFTVTRADDDGVLCLPAEPTCTLRYAINAANSNPGLDTIRFQIGGSTPIKTINLVSALPSITDPVIIDGTTQPGYAGQPLIELNGASAGPGANGLAITAGGTTVKGLVINRFSADGIRMNTNGGNTIQGNYIGTDATGNLKLANGLVGVRVVSAANNLVGGSTNGARNIISGNLNSGVVIQGAGSIGNQLQGNYIGTNVAGNAALSNPNGVFVATGASNNFIGGPSSGMGNVISGNSNNGIEIRDSGSDLNTVQGNFIGTDRTGNSGVPNAGNGIVIRDNAVGSIVGGDADAERNVISGNGLSGILILTAATATNVEGNFIGTNAAGTGSLGNTFSGVEINNSGGNTVLNNTIAFNRRDGITAFSGTANSFLNNRTFSNDGLAIDLGPDGVTPNDATDADSGANNQQNFPVITSVSHSGDTLTIRFTRDFAPAPSTYRLEFFANASCDSSGSGEGDTLIVRSDLLNFGGSGSFTIVSGGSPIPPGRFITATATRLLDPKDTSEFSPCVQVVTPGSMQLSSNSYSANENAGSAPVTINRVGGSDGSTTVFFSTSNGTATAGEDFTNATGVLNFANGETSKTVLVPITNDNVAEGNETINLSLAQTTGGAPLGTPSTAVLTINDNDAGSFVEFGSSNYSGGEDCATALITVQRTGDTSVVSTVKYATGNGTASDRTDFTAAFGSLRFEPGETQKSFVVLLNEDSHTEGTESASITLSNPTNAMVGAPSIATLSILDDSSEPSANAIDDSGRFVCQHYHDFLNRQADIAGQQFWVNQIESCGSDSHCREIKRINVSAAFFLSIEFQQTGYLVYRMYKAAYGNMAGAPVPVALQEFLPDTQTIGRGVQVGIGDWQIQLENNKSAFANEFAGRPRFTNAFPTGMTPAQYVDALNANSGGALSAAERNQFVNDLAGGVKTRAQVLRAVAEDSTLVQTESNKAFVLMQYFGYLRRNPNGIPDTDFSGYNFWLQKLNQFGGNFVEAEMVKSFLVAGEYRHRFGQ